MKVEKYVDYIVKMIPEFELEGLRIYWSGEYYENYRVDRVPIYKVDNPNNIPFTKIAISAEIEERISTIQKFLPYIDIAPMFLYYLYCDDLYIPQKTLNKISKCLKGSKFEKMKEFSIDGLRKEFLVKCSFDGNFSILIDSEAIEWNVNVSIDEAVLYYDGEVEVLSKKDTREITLDLYEDYIENEIWDCIQEDIGENKAFVNFDFMGWYTLFKHI